MDLSFPNSTTNSPLSTPSVFGDNMQDLLGRSALNVNPSAIITVNSTADTLDHLNSGVTTLRDAINQANGDTGEDLIVFDRSLFSNQQTITLSGTELDITHNLDIIAPRDELTGGDLVTISGNKASRVFEIEGGATVNLSGLIVADGQVTGDNGGGIKNSGTLTLDSSIVRNNSAIYKSGSFLHLSGEGGGIDSSANLTVINSTISGNSALNGGGISNGGISTVNNSTISGNSASTGGGGIYTYDGTLEVNNSTISDNSALSGGGIRNDFFKINTNGINTNGISTVNNSTISGNSASFSSGGIDNSGINTVNNSTISGNTAPVIGGIDNSGINTVNNSTISGNSTSGDGGGIYNSGSTTVNNSTISGNSASSGGGIYSSGSTTVNNSTISGNSASGNGGGICADNGTTVNNSTISGNKAIKDGGGIFNYLNNFNAPITVNNSTISGNKASGDGGGIYGDAKVSNSTISSNSASGNGGGIYNKGILTVVFSTITLNQSGNGGGMYNSTDTVLNRPGEKVSASVRNTIIAANLNSDGGVNADVSGTFTSNGYNLIGDGTGSTGFDATGDMLGTSDNPIDPRLAPLDFYGGSTQTIALLPDSPAIGAGDPTVLDTDPTTDQRGLPRRAADGSTDIGAFEFSS